MCYIIAKNFKTKGSIAYKTKPGKDLSNMNIYLSKETIKKDIQIVILGDNLDIYGEYKPYKIIENKNDFIKNVLSME